MNGEFSFDGKSCTEFGLHYIPDAGDRWYSAPEYETIDEEVTGRSGGYWYGTRVKVQTFNLPCYFEDNSIERLEAVYRWLSRNKEGKLVFEDRPFVYYNVRPILPSSAQVWWHEIQHRLAPLGSGKVTLNFKAYEPFSYMKYDRYEEIDKDGAEMRCGIIEAGMMPPAIQPIAGQYLVYNPGSETAYPTLRIAGSAPDGLTLTNMTTGRTCTLLGFNMAENTWLEINGRSGKISIEPVGTPAFEYHVDGYLDLASCQPYERDVVVTKAEGSATVTVENLDVDTSYVGRYVYLEDAWRRILYVYNDGRTFELDASMTESSTENTMIAVLNRIELEGDNMSLTSLELEYTPMLR